jgi:hypothetical protein
LDSYSGKIAFLLGFVGFLGQIPGLLLSPFAGVLIDRTMAFMGMVPFGSLLAGSLASKIGAPGTIMISGVACILGSIPFARKLPALREMVRPIYIEKEILSKELK